MNPFPYLNLRTKPRNLRLKSSKLLMRVSPKSMAKINSTAMLTHFRMYTRARRTDERGSEETHSPEEPEQSKTDGKPQSMTDMVNQITGAISAFVIPSTITVPQKTHGKPSKGKSQAKSLAAKRSENNR